jgi:hypothetical protein
MLSAAEAVLVIVAFENQSRLTSDQKEYLEKARTLVWNHANGVIARETHRPITACM